MLTPERAREELSAVECPDVVKRLEASLKALPAALREIAADVFVLWEYRSFRRQGEIANWLERGRKAVVELDRLSLDERASVFSALGPKLAPALESAWHLFKRGPYQSGFERKAFRAPGQIDVYVDRLFEWLPSLAALAARYPAEILSPAWLAAWAPHVDPRGVQAQDIGLLLAGAIDRQDGEADEVYGILSESLDGRHEIGGPGRHVYTAMLSCNRAEAWEAMEKLLLAAERQEGLRQAIFESLDLAHPEAIRRMLRLVQEHDLLRFSSVVREVNEWFGILRNSGDAHVMPRVLQHVVTFLEAPAARREALRGDDAEAAFLALWCQAVEDAVASVTSAAKLLQSPKVELRYVAALHLRSLDLPSAWDALKSSVDDEDLRVALTAVAWTTYLNGSRQTFAAARQSDRFEPLERLLVRTPTDRRRLEPLVWPWNSIYTDRSHVAAALLESLQDRPISQLLPHLPTFDPEMRGRAIRAIAARKPWDDATRQAVVAMAGDASSMVSSSAFEALQRLSLRPNEVEQLESLLTRKAGNVRRSVLELLLKQPDDGALESSRRLMSSKDTQQRLAGLELLRLLVDQQRCVAACCAEAKAFRTKRKRLLKGEQNHLQHIEAAGDASPALDDEFGDFSTSELTPRVPPRNRKARFVTPAAVACLEALDKLIHEHREATIEIESWDDKKEEVLLGNVQWGFPRPEPRAKQPRDIQRQQLPLADVWCRWYEKRPKASRDKDGFELLRASIWLQLCGQWDDVWHCWAAGSPHREKLLATISGKQAPPALRYPHLVGYLVDWLQLLYPCDPRDYLLDAVETSYALIPAEAMAGLQRIAAAERARALGGSGVPSSESSDDDEDDDEDDVWNADWRVALPIAVWSEAFHNAYQCEQELTPEQEVRLWRLMHWRDQPIEGAPRMRPPGRLLRAAHRAGAATLDDVAEHLLAPRDTDEPNPREFELLSALTARQLDDEDAAWLRECPDVAELVDRAVTQVLDLELSRGDAPTAATAAAHALGAVKGIETVRRILRALGKMDFKTRRWWGSDIKDRRESLTGLARNSFPADGETPEDFARVMRAAVDEGQFPEERLLQLVFVAPQWIPFVEAYFGLPEMREGIYWFLAHMAYAMGLEEVPVDASEDEPPDDDTTDSDPFKDRRYDRWRRLILERTPLSEVDRAEGAIDVAWFQRTYALLKDDRWQQLAKAARFAATAAQARRAAFIGDVLLGRVDRQELVDGIQKRQLKEHVRLLGLLPLARGKKRQADLRERFRVLQEYRQYANRLSGLSKPDALRAWEIGMRNLAQTAGYADPLRLEWALGAEAVEDLRDGPLTVQKNGVAISLSLGEAGAPLVVVQKGEKRLKAVPPAIKKDREVAALTSRVPELKKLSSSMRQSLEGAMCRGDHFTGAELRGWFDHALLVPLVSRLVLVGEGILGYPDRGGKALRDHKGSLEPIKAQESLRLAHPHDLFESGAWDKWQRECFTAERIQPFKQVFRELYVLTPHEKDGKAVSQRYTGHQVQPSQAAALFGQRGWNTREGVFKVFHDLQLTAVVDFDLAIGTPLEVECPTLEGIRFVKRDEWKPIPLVDVPPRVFSEVMRDVDLVVSVAHAGGVDPEASESTVEMRASLLRETCGLLNLANVRFKESHALVDGELAQYSVHLGSGTVHKLPGGSLCIVPVPSQHRGRLFLPFADDDPRTAEVISKVLLLARDREIKDPIILEQIRA